MDHKDTYIRLTDVFVSINSKKFFTRDYMDCWSDILVEFAESTGISLDTHYSEFDTEYASNTDGGGFHNRLILLCADVLRKGLATVEFNERTYDRMTSLSKFVNHPDVFLNIYARDTWFFGNMKMYILGYRGGGGALMPDIRVRRPEIKLRLERI